ncbi:LOW QUALITY PROTEIN: musculin [Eublepharis macularius]|uniref:LOW QUALITY PROTEIN: musculin n=1 Tax=Eublepharis macularius TaxID=481883 RepID=A0AA97JNK7_EUBMA|nr:LOW QUALITY PROTEIN: musculin [Eublepharis macularius]
MSTGSLSDTEELPQMDLRGLPLGYAVPPRSKRHPRGESCPSVDSSSAAEEDEEEEEEGCGARKKRRTKGAPESKRQAPSGRSATAECKQTQRNAANARERARMRVLSKAFSRLKTSLPWVPPDTKLSKLDTLRLASSYIAHLRQLLQEDRYEKGYVHPVNLTWPFVVSGRPECTPKRFLQPTDYVELQHS